MYNVYLCITVESKSAPFFQEVQNNVHNIAPLRYQLAQSSLMTEMENIASLSLGTTESQTSPPQGSLPFSSPTVSLKPLCFSACLPAEMR